MRMLYLGQLFEGATSLDRMRVIRDLGVEGDGFDMLPYVSMGPRVTHVVAHRFNFGAPVRKLNAALADLAGGPTTYTHVWVDKGTWIEPRTLRAMVEAWGCRLVHYTPDAAFYWNRSRQFRASVPMYDVLFTTKPFEMDLYKQAGARRVYLTYQA